MVNLFITTRTNICQKIRKGTAGYSYSYNRTVAIRLKLRQNSCYGYDKTVAIVTSYDKITRQVEESKVQLLAVPFKEAATWLYRCNLLAPVGSF